MQEFISQIEASQEVFARNTADQIKKLQDAEAKRNLLVEMLKARLVTLVPALEKRGLNLTDLRFYLNDNGSLVVSAKGVPYAGSKFRFIKFAGYDAQGRGRNRKTLDAKKDKLEEALGVFVNEFSLEAKDVDANNRVLLCWNEVVT
jgi:hypothetical protein